MTRVAGVLIVLSGLPGTGKSSMARRLADTYSAVYLRIDTIEQALLRAGAVAGKIGPAGYSVAYAMAEENLRLGLIVIADSVNPLALTREAWRATAMRAGAQVIEVEVCCSDVAEHRRRIDTRKADIDGHRLPAWQDVLDRTYEPWSSERIVIDTANLEPDVCAELLDQPLRAAIAACRSGAPSGKAPTVDFH
jgi:predicted kinase